MTSDPKSKPQIESFYPLSPMQAGMLFHTLFEPGSGMYVELFSVQIRGKLDIHAFELAWQKALERHSILRTSFVWEGVKEPIQVVHQSVKLPFSYQDWREKPAAEQQSELHHFMNAEQMRGFDLSRPPLMRMALIQTSPDQFTFVWTHHHILLDGWSVPILLNGVLSQYRAIRAGSTAEFPSERPFKDYIVWLKNQDLAKSENYWRAKLAGFTNPTPLPVDRSDVHNKDEGSGFLGFEFEITKKTTLALQDQARRNGLTLNTLIQGAWSILLSRYSGEEDIVFGTTISGRPADLPGSETMLGLFINTLPVRVRVPGDEKLSVWLKDLQASQSEMRQYEYTPLFQIQSWSDVSRGLPLFNSLYVFENIPLSGLGSNQPGDVMIETGHAESYSNFPISVVAVPGEKISIKFTYAAQLFDADLIRRMAHQMETLLDNISSGLDQQLGKISLLDEAEKRHVLVDWNQTSMDLPDNMCAHHMFEALVRKIPNKEAVRFENKSLSYLELDIRANQLAEMLRSLGVGPNVLVGISTDRSPEMVIGIFGVLKAGGAYVPMDPTYPRERLDYMIQDSQISIFLTQQHLLDRLPISVNSESDHSEISGPRIICLDADWLEIEQYSAANNQLADSEAQLIHHHPETKPDDLAYVIYTSGSTGKPKGAMLRHIGLINLTLSSDHIFNVSQKSRVLQFSPFSFDASVWELFVTLSNGGTIVLGRKEVLASKVDLLKLLKEEEITAVLLPPSVLRLFRADEVTREALPFLETVISGGEACGADIVAVWAPGRKFFNAYGPTEITVCACGYLCNAAETGQPPIGKPLANTKFYVLDQGLQPVPIGVPGELHISGVGLARGYLNRPELTKEKFIQNPFLLVEDELELDQQQADFYRLMYKTGDLVRYRSDGNLEYLGRIDHQVKVRGIRIELGEIENVLLGSPGIKDAVVILREDSPGEKQLVAYLVPEFGEHTGKQEAFKINVSALRNYLKEKLPEALLPAIYITMKSLPLTPSLKVDRKALPRPQGFRPTLEVDYVAPQTQREIDLAEIWKRVLKIEKVGLNDNFFELGGDSILSLQIISLAKKAGIDISYRQLFETPTIRGLADQASLPNTMLAEQGLVSGFVPLTPIQDWFFDHHADAPHHFNTSIMVEVTQGVLPEVLEESIRQIIIHHDGLRTHFDKTDHGWRQTVDDVPTNLPIYYVDLAQQLDSIQENNAFQLPPGDSLQRTINNIIKEKADRFQSSIDLQKSPLFKVVLFHLGQGRSDQLLFIFHHLVFDGVSARIFVDDFLTIYLHQLSGTQVKLPAKTISYKYWAEVLIEAAQSEIMQDQKRYWARLIDRPTAKMPVDFPDGLNTYGTTKQITVSLEQFETELLLRHLPAKTGIKTYTILLFGLARLFCRLSHTTEFLVELEGHGREQIAGTALDQLDVSRTIGWFTSIYPFLVNLGSQSIDDYPGAAPGDQKGKNLSLLVAQLHSVQEQLDKIPDRGVGFGILKYLSYDAQVRQLLGRVPEPEINFNYLGQFDQGPSDPTLVNETLQTDNSSPQEILNPPPIRIISESVGDEQDPGSKRSAKLYIVAIVTGGRLGVRWLYSEGLHKRSSIVDLAEAYLEELRSISSFLN